MWWKPSLSTGQRRKMMRERQLARHRNPALAEIVEQNIDAIDEHRLNAKKNRTRQERIADAITQFTGSIPFIYFHAVWFAIWIVANLGIGGLPAFDPFPFGLLTTIVSLEAIFLSTFVLVSQNRQAQVEDRRSELDLQINLLAEHEITRILAMVAAMGKRLDVDDAKQDELKELRKDVKPEAVLEELEARAENHDAPSGAGVANQSRSRKSQKKGRARGARASASRAQSRKR
jgi:uncharacterized membrane protein